ncbi:MAG: DNA polymerase III subunit alpha [Candidatus Aenigmarchaeota archaeon]|nr:DNA polymerase III subunit alpha [Candidatus Aenigmarchaeota archaeon]
MSKFVHLHVHTHYSLLDGLAKIPALLDKTKEMGMDTLAITDHGVMYGVIEFYKEAKDRGIKPIIGCEMYIAPRAMQDKTPKLDTNPYHLVLLCKDKTGYLNLIELVTKAHLEGYYYRPRIDKDLLKKHKEGLVALSGCHNGEVGTHLMSGNLKAAEKSAMFYKELFEEDFYLELQDHPDWEEQIKLNKDLVKLGEKLGIPIVITKDAHYIEKSDSEAHDVLLCLQTGSFISDIDRLKIEGDLSLVPPTEISERFKEYPEAVKNTVKIAEKCNLEIDLGQILLPHFEVPKGETPKSYLEKLVREGIKKRYLDLNKEVQEKVDFELSVIEKMGYETYFLVVADFVNWAKSQGILVGPGRGSAAGSIVSYVLGITDLNPLKYNLLFERFLNPDRISMPDVDLDFADDRRDEVIEYVAQKYGHDHVAQIITFGTMMARVAIRDTGRVLGMSYSEVDRIAKVTPPHMSLRESIKVIPELKNFYDSDEQIKKLLDLAVQLEGVARHASTHAAGVVISREPLKNYVPLQKATKGELAVITQYSMGPLEDIGLLKMDFLGLANLTILKNTLRIIKKVYGKEIDLTKILLDDKKTYELLSKGETIGVFQLESSGMKRYIKELKPTCLEDIVAMVALYRPGPMQWIDDFIKRKHGKAKISYPHPLVENALKSTYGVAVYQEQVMQIARDLAGFSGGEADTLRKAMGKKIGSLMQKQRKSFIEGAVKNNVSRSLAEKVFDSLQDFAAYAFNKSHAACYGMITYETAYLKAHYPAAFMAALMTSDYGNIDKIAVEVEECQRMGITVLPPDVNESFAEFGVVKESGNIRFGMMAIKNIGTGIIEAIVSARDKGKGPFKNIDDFARRVSSKELNKKALESLIKCGAMDSLGTREELLGNMEKISHYASKVQRHKENGQIDLFGDFGIDLPSLTLEKVPEKFSSREKLAWEKELLGLYISEHPLDEYKDYINNLDITQVKDLEKVDSGVSTKVAGVITQVQRVLTRTKETMLFVKVEDKTGSAEVLVFPTVLKKDALLWGEGRVVLVEGKISVKDGAPKILCDGVREVTSKSIQDKDKKESVLVSGKKAIIQIKIPVGASQDVLTKTKEILFKNQGEVKTFVYVPNDGGTKKIELPFGVKRSEELVSSLVDLLGVGSVEMS